MKSLEEHLKDINAKCKQLVKKYEMLQKENLKLTDGLHEFAKKEKESGEKIEKLETELSILKAAAGNMSQPDRTQLEKQINQYIKDIEKCMTMLNK